jgi:uroporphyrinogen decarboxylase
MLPRERVLCALRREWPDRTPRDFWAEKPALNRLFDAIGYRDEERLLQKLGIDLRHLNAIEPPELEVRPGLYRNFWGEQYVYRPTPWGPMREDVKGALAGAAHFGQVEAFPFPTPDVMNHGGLKQQCDCWEPYALVYGFADVWQRPALVRGWEEWFMDLVERPAWVHFLCRKFTDFYLEEYTRAAEATQGRIDLYLLISDLGTQRGPLISLAMFQEFVAPYVAEMVRRIHALGGLVLFHSCGLVYPFIAELIRLGVDVLDPVQPLGPTMTPERLKAEFGPQLCFHGGIDMQALLPYGSPDQVRLEARHYSDVFAQGGYILAPAHLFQPEVPPANILAMYE